MAAQPLYTVEEYLAFERANDERHEYIDGLIYPVGECPTQPDIPGNHADISANLVILVVRTTAEFSLPRKNKRHEGSQRPDSTSNHEGFVFLSRRGGDLRRASIS